MGGISGTGGANQTNTATSNTTQSAARPGAPPSGSTLYLDDYSVVVSEQRLQKVINTSGADWHDISDAQSAYNDALSIYSADLKADIGIQSSSWTAAQANTGGTARGTPANGVGQNFEDAKNWDQDQLDHLSTYYKQPLFTDQNADSSPVSRVNASAFPGGSQGAAYSDWVNATGNVQNGRALSTDARNLPKGYTSPPSIGSSTNIASVYNDLTPNQAAFLGWSLGQAANNNQVGIPPEDAQNWNTLAEYAISTGNYQKDTGAYAGFADSYNPIEKTNDTPNISVDELVGQAAANTKSVSAGQWAEIALGIASAFLPIGAFGEAADVAGEAADGAAAAAAGVSDVGASGLVEAADPALAALPDGTVPNAFADAADSFSDGVDEAATGDAAAAKPTGTALTTDQLSSLNQITNKDGLSDIVQRANDALADTNGTASGLANDQAYQDLLKVNGGGGSMAIGDTFAKANNLTADEAQVIRQYCNVGQTGNPDALTSALDKLPKQAGDTFRYTDLDADTLNKILSGGPLTVEDLTAGTSPVLATTVGAYAKNIGQASVKLVIDSASTSDGSTWVAPLSTYGLNENEAVYYGGYFTPEGATQAADGTWTIYLSHTAAAPD